MRRFAKVATLGLWVLALGAAPAIAQQPPATGTPAQTKPAQPPATGTQPPATGTQPPATGTQPPATVPQPPAPAAATPQQPPPPFPAGAKIGFINPQAIFQQSSDGKAALARVQALIQKKQKEGEDKAKALQSNQQKLQTGGSVMNDAARSQLEKEIDRQQKEIERFQQDAQTEINELQQELQNEFLKKVNPLLDQVANEKGLQMVLNADTAGIAWANMGLDLGPEIVKKLDAMSNKPAASPKQ